MDYQFEHQIDVMYTEQEIEHRIVELAKKIS